MCNNLYCDDTTSKIPAQRSTFHFNENMNLKIVFRPTEKFVIEEKMFVQKRDFSLFAGSLYCEPASQGGGRTKQPLSGFSLRIFSSQNTVLAQNRPPGKRDCAGKV